jgi:hypothetical protein
MVAYPLAALTSLNFESTAPLRSFYPVSMHAESVARSWHVILATGCLCAPAMASTLFCREAYRAAFFFDLEEDFDFALVVFVALRLVFREEECVREDGRVLFALTVVLRLRVRGASLIGSATANERPGFTTLEER